MNCERIHPLLAAYVDGELADLERRAVEDHVAKCHACRELLDEQRAAAEAYALYPVAEPQPAEWRTVWEQVEAHLPARAKRLTLESLSEMDLSSEFPAEDEAAVRPRPPAKPKTQDGRVPSELRPASLPADRQGRPHRDLPWFKPMRIPQLRYMGWAHVAGITAAVLIVVMVVLGAKPVLHTDQLATADQVDISFDITGAASDPVVVLLQTDAGGEVPMIWVARGATATGAKEEAVQ